MTQLGHRSIEKLVVVTKKTALEELVLRFNSRDQARFYLEQNEVPFDEYERADARYHQSLHAITRALPRGLKAQFIDRDLLPTYQFGDHDAVLTVGPDGLVINTAKYLATQPILAVNPDPSRIDGTFLPWGSADVARAIDGLRKGIARIAPVRMAQVTLNDGQRLYAVNDIFIGTRSHGSARYELALGDHREQHSTSGIIVSTGAGCTGWLRSLTTGAWEIARYFGAQGDPPTAEQLALGWDADRLWYSVREPFVSKVSAASLVFGQLGSHEELVITSQMADSGVIFSDGIEADFLQFNSGFMARVGIADRKAHLVVRD